MSRSKRVPRSWWPLLWDHDPATLSCDEDRDFLIGRVLAEGGWRATQELRARFGDAAIRGWLVARRVRLGSCGPAWSLGTANGGLSLQQAALSAAQRRVLDRLDPLLWRDPSTSRAGPRSRCGSGIVDRSTSLSRQPRDAGIRFGTSTSGLDPGAQR